MGLSTENLRDPKILEAFLFEANNSGIDFIDCAWRYGNEPYIGMALKSIKTKNYDFNLIVPFQSKVWPTKFSGGINKSLRFSLSKIGAFSCLEAYFLHFPHESWGQNLSAYKSLIECMNRGQIKKVGLGNFDVELLEKLFTFTNKHPDILQFDLSVNNLDLSIFSYCKKNDIELQSCNPFGEYKSNLRNPVICDIALRCNTTVKNVLLSYLLQLDIVPVFPASDPFEIHELIKSKKIFLSKEDMKKLEQLNRYKVKRRKTT